MKSAQQLCILYCVACTYHHYRSETVSLTCDDTTDACPGTELTCTCRVESIGLVWDLEIYHFLLCQSVNATNTAGIFTAMITELPAGGGIVSVLRYNATQTLVNSNIVCNDGAVTITHIFISHKQMNEPS